MSKQEYDTSGYPVERDNFTTNLTWAFLGLCFVVVTAGLILLAIQLFDLIFG